MDKRIEKEMDAVATLYSNGLLGMREMKKLKEKFNLSCAHCKSEDVRVMVKGDDDGYCDTCSNPYAKVVFKCTVCGQAIGFKD